MPRSLISPVALLAALALSEASSGELPKSPIDASHPTTTVCALTQGSKVVTATYRVVTGRLSRGASGFVLLDDTCAGASLQLRESAPGILGETCDASRPKSGLRCLLDSTSQPVFGTVSGMYERKSGSSPTLVVWDLTDVSFEAPNNRWRGP
jgi:hypothetical protein